MDPILGQSGDHNAPAANTAASITLAAASPDRHVIDQIHYSYSGAPTGGKLTVESPAATVLFEVEISAAGPGQVDFAPGLMAEANTAMIVTLAAGGAGVSGKLTVRHRRA